MALAAIVGVLMCILAKKKGLPAEYVDDFFGLRYIKRENCTVSSNMYESGSSEIPQHFPSFSVKQMNAVFATGILNKKLKENREDLPKWVKNSKNWEQFATGGSKRVFSVNERFAVTLEAGPREFVTRRRYVLEKLKDALQTLPDEKRNVVFAEDIYEVYLNDKVSALFSLLNLCGEDLFDFAKKAKHKFDYEVDLIKEFTPWVLPLVYPIQALHDHGMYLIDIKPENMLVCNGRPYLTDVEDVVFLGETYNGNTSIHYSREIVEAMSKVKVLNDSPLRDLRLRTIDWYALASSLYFVAEQIEVYVVGRWSPQTLFNKAIEYTLDFGNDLFYATGTTTNASRRPQRVVRRDIFGTSRVELDDDYVKTVVQTMVKIREIWRRVVPVLGERMEGIESKGSKLLLF